MPLPKLLRAGTGKKKTRPSGESGQGLGPGVHADAPAFSDRRETGRSKMVKTAPMIGSRQPGCGLQSSGLGFTILQLPLGRFNRRLNPHDYPVAPS